MFALFFSLYVAMFRGTYSNYNWGQIVLWTKDSLNVLGSFITSIFGNNTYNNLGDLTNDINGLPAFVYLICLLLTIITSIGIVVMAVKGIKKAFGIFFMGLRR